jgi:hypothetical protein
VSDHERNRHNSRNPQIWKRVLAAKALPSDGCRWGRLPSCSAFFVAVIHREVIGMSESTRPKRVVIVDADNPLQEIQGEFFWREDHDRIVAEQRQAAYARGYDEGFEAATRRQAPTFVLRPRRRGRLRRMILLAIALFFLIAYAIDVAIPALVAVLSP